MPSSKFHSNHRAKSLRNFFMMNALGPLALLALISVTQGGPVDYGQMINDCVRHQTAMDQEECSHCTKCYVAGCFQNPTGNTKDLCTRAKCRDLPGCQSGAPFSDDSLTPTPAPGNGGDTPKATPSQTTKPIQKTRPTPPPTPLIEKTSCTEQYGRRARFCRQTESECTYNVRLNGDTCDDFCEDHGGICLYSHSNDGNSCRTQGTNFCNVPFLTNTCTCSRGYDPPPRAPPRPTRCTTQYGSDILVCEETSTRCMFFVELGGESCNTYCRRLGGTCYRAEHNDGKSCLSTGVGYCSSRLDDNICSCSLEDVPTTSPTEKPTPPPSPEPRAIATPMPTEAPSPQPTVAATLTPTQAPTSSPTPSPSPHPTAVATPTPTPAPSPQPTVAATPTPTQAPTVSPSSAPTARSTPQPTVAATPTPTQAPTVSPTSAPTAGSTLQPTVAATRTPTQSPTSSPTSSPTAGPSPFPSLKPTKAPTPTPTNEPSLLSSSPLDSSEASSTPNPTGGATKPVTSMPTLAPPQTPAPSVSTQAPSYNILTKTPSTIADYRKMCRKCDRLGCFTAETPANRIRCAKFDCSSMINCPTYKLISAQLTTDKPKVSTTAPLPRSDPTLSPTSQAQFSVKPTSSPSSLDTGMTCSTDLECISGTCRNGACMASRDCYPVKHTFGSSFDRNKINLVFVGSGFETDDKWRNEVNKTYSIFKGYKMFDESINQLNVFYVSPRVHQRSFCDYDCGGIGRLLCCEPIVAQALSSRCFPEGANLQTVVIHNDDRYGGAGYTFQNLATMSTHPQGALVAVHELGHSLFELTDEYSYGPGTDKDPNCASTNECSKWEDLIGRELDDYNKVKCEPGCRNGNFFVAESSYMDILRNPVGAVNSRYTCCTYQALTKEFPSYCKAFDFSPGYLLNFCRKFDYQNYGSFNYDPEPKQSIKVGPQGETSKYIHVTDPILLSVQLKRGSKSGAVILDKPRSGPPGLYRTNQVNGDYKKAAAAFADGVKSIVRVRVNYINGYELLFFDRNTTIEIPSLPAGDANTQGNQLERVSEEANIVNIVLDSRGRMLRSVKAKVLRRR